MTALNQGLLVADSPSFGLGIVKRVLLTVTGEKVYAVVTAVLEAIRPLLDRVQVRWLRVRGRRVGESNYGYSLRGGRGPFTRFHHGFNCNPWILRLQVLEAL